MEERKILSYTLGKEAGEKSIIRIYSDGQQIQYFGFTNDGEAYEKTFAIPLDGLKRFRRSLQPWLVRNVEVDLENLNNYHWTLKLDLDGVRSTTMGEIVTEDDFQKLKENLLFLLVELEKEYVERS